jgi:uncharacterized repeat protein (TIGR03803 family)
MNTIDWKNDLLANVDTAGDWAGGAGPPTDPDAVPFNAGVGLGNAASAEGVATKGPKLTTLVSFTHADGAYPEGGLIADAAGDLFGTTDVGGGNGGDTGYGVVFEVAKTKSGYASAPTTLVDFDSIDGSEPNGGVIADASGDLFGTTSGGGPDSNYGTVFELTKTKHGYAPTPTTLVSFTNADGAYPQGALFADAAGDLFGTTELGGADNDGTVFEIAKTKSGYASAPATVVSFTGADGASPFGSLIADAAGDLFGTAASGGADNDGTVFEIAKTKSGYASATTLVSFTGSDGANPYGSLIADAAGDLFGTTAYGGTGYTGPDTGDGTVFEIAKTKSGYASAPTTLVSFTGADGASPAVGLIADAAGNTSPR